MGGVEILKKEISQGLKLHHSELNPLMHIAAQRDHSQVIRCLVSDLEASPECLDENQKTPLFTACLNESFQVVQFLVEEAKVDLHQEWRGKTALEVALETSCEPLIDFLKDSRKTFLRQFTGTKTSFDSQVRPSDAPLVRDLLEGSSFKLIRFEEKKWGRRGRSKVLESSSLTAFNLFF